MAERLEPIDYEQLALAKLEDAAQSSSLRERCAHLDQAAVFAAKGEAARRAAHHAAHLAAHPAESEFCA